MAKRTADSNDEQGIERERRRVLQLLGVGGLSVGLAGCAGGGGGDETTTTQGETGGGGGEDTATETETTADDSGEVGPMDISLNFANPSQLSTMDVHKSNRVPEQITLNAIHEPLFRLSPDKKAVSTALLSDWELHEEGRQFVFQIADGITFHDGTDLTGEVVAYNLRRFNEIGTNASVLGGPSNIEASGDMEVTVEYDSPYPRLPVYLAGFYTGMVSKEAAESAGDNYGFETVVGTGPFKFINWEKDNKVELTRYDDYTHGVEWAQNQGPARVKDLTIRRIPEETTRIQELINGDLDAISIPSSQKAQQIQNAGNTEFHQTPFPYPSFFTMNMQREPTSDVRVRRALNHAVRRGPILEASLSGYGTKIWGLAPPVSVNGLPEDVAKKQGYTYNPERARQILDEAGWTNSSQGEIRTKNGNELKLVHLAFDLPAWSSQAEVAQQMFKQVGVKTELKIAEGGTFYNTIENQGYHMVGAGTSANFAVDFLFSVFHSDNLATKGGFNTSMFDSDEMDSLIDKGRTDPDPEARADAVREAELLEREQAASIPIQVVHRTYARKTSVKGIDAFLNHPWWPNQYYIHWTDVYTEQS